MRLRLGAAVTLLVAVYGTNHVDADPSHPQNNYMRRGLQHDNTTIQESYGPPAPVSQTISKAPVPSKPPEPRPTPSPVPVAPVPPVSCSLCPNGEEPPYPDRGVHSLDEVSVTTCWKLDTEILKQHPPLCGFEKELGVITGVNVAYYCGCPNVAPLPAGCRGGLCGNDGTLELIPDDMNDVGGFSCADWERMASSAVDTQFCANYVPRVSSHCCRAVNPTTASPITQKPTTQPHPTRPTPPSRPPQTIQPIFFPTRPTYPPHPTYHPPPPTLPKPSNPPPPTLPDIPIYPRPSPPQPQPTQPQPTNKQHKPSTPTGYD